MSDGSHAEDWDELSLLRGSRVGEFELTGIIGKGGFGIVYLALDHSLDRVVALKEYMPASLASRKNHTHVNPRSERQRDTYEAGLRSFVNEAKLLAQFDNPALVKVHRFWEANGTAYMAMPYYKGLTVAQTVRGLPAPPEEAWLMELLAPLTEALMELHAAKCYHRDVAPDNILILADSGFPLLLDFGAARRVIADQTQAPTVILKAGYAPIEQYGDVPGLQQGAWTDVYALASVVYWSIIGKTPPPSVGRMIRDSYVPLVQCAPAQYSRRLATAIDRALFVMPGDRTQSIAHFRKDLGLAPFTVGRTSSKRTDWSDPDRTVIKASRTSDGLGERKEVSRTDGAGIRDGVASTASAHPTEGAPEARPRRGVVMAVVVAAVLLLGAASGFWLFTTDRKMQASSNEVPERSTLPPSAQSTVTPPLPPSPQVVPVSTPIPRSATDALALILEKSNPELKVAVDLGSTTPARGVGKREMTYTSGEAGHLYLLGRQPARDELQLLLPPANSPPARAETTGKLELPLDVLKPGAWELVLVVARQPLDLVAFGWTAEGILWKRRFGVDASQDARRLLPWRLPECPPALSNCSAAYGAAAFQLEVDAAPIVEAAKQAPIPPLAAASKAPRSSPAPRVDLAGAAPKSPRARMDPECEKILMRMSLGETQQELVDRMKTLKCN